MRADYYPSKFHIHIIVALMMKLVLGSEKLEV